MIVLKSEPIFFESSQMIFKGFFDNTKEQMNSHNFANKDHCLWFQKPLNLLIMEQRTNYIAAIFLYILEFLSV